MIKNAEFMSSLQPTQMGMMTKHYGSIPRPTLLFPPPAPQSWYPYSQESSSMIVLDISAQVIWGMTRPPILPFARSSSFLNLVATCTFLDDFRFREPVLKS